MNVRDRDPLELVALVVTAMHPLRRLKEGDEQGAEIDDERIDLWLDNYELENYPDSEFFGGSSCQ